MSDRTILVAGNWKMNGSRAMTGELIRGLAAAFGGTPPCDVAVCPSFVYLSDAAEALAGTGIDLGAQDLCTEDSGAFTGETAGGMLKDLCCRYVIVGHSERRSLYGEDNETVAKKFLAALRHGLEPIVCVGESLDERERNVTNDVVGAQLKAVIAAAGVGALANAVIAYEPVWAIGTGRTASPEQAQEVHAFVRGIIAAEDGIIGDSIRILYGGSVKSSNAGDLFSMPDVDGGLVGGASLEAQGFAEICRAGG